MVKIIVLSVFIFLGCAATAQVKIGYNVTDINDSSLLELESTTKGVLFPRVALTSTTTFAPLQSHVIGMTVYNTATTGNVTPGMYTNDGIKWVKLGSESINQNFVDLISNQTIAGNKTFIGVSIAPTAELGTNSTQLATTEFVANALNSINTATTPLSIKTSNYAIENTDYTILCNATNAGFNLILPEATVNRNKIFIIRKIDATNNLITFTPNIYITDSETVSTLNYPKTIKIQSNGTNWYLIN